jgi:16S rRNA (guanine1516-N2)-methyltransferase
VRLAVTTGRDVDVVHHERAALLAARFSCPLLPRASYARMARDAGVDCFYVVRATHDELCSVDGHAAHVQPGLMPTKLGEGLRHPLIRAVRGALAGSSAGDGACDERGEDVGVVFDGTLGLANDAVHIAAVTGARVDGCEGSAVLHALLEEGLPRIACSTERWAAAAARVTVRHGDSATVLATLPDDSVDVVVLDPMMSHRRRSAPSFHLLRAFAVHDRASPRLLAEARRVARRRVVLKLGKGAPLPVSRSIEFPRVVTGAHVVYWVHEKHRDAVFSDEPVEDGRGVAGEPR